MSQCFTSPNYWGYLISNSYLAWWCPKSPQRDIYQPLYISMSFASFFGTLAQWALPATLQNFCPKVILFSCGSHHMHHGNLSKTTWGARLGADAVYNFQLSGCRHIWYCTSSLKVSTSVVVRTFTVYICFVAMLFFRCWGQRWCSQKLPMDVAREKESPVGHLREREPAKARPALGSSFRCVFTRIPICRTYFQCLQMQFARFRTKASRARIRNVWCWSSQRIICLFQWRLLRQEWMM